MRLSEELAWRGFVNQTTYKSLTELDEKPITFYWGVDPSADSMTIGNFAVAMLVRHMIDAGHKAYLLVGGATGRIGDPDGKKDERSLKDEETVDNNVKGIARQYRQIFEGKDFKIVNNYDWFKSMNYIDFLRVVGKYVPMSQMLGREFIRARLGDEGAGISYAEFSYSLIQGYDFLYQYRRYGTTLQICGADQWGNSVTGVDLIRRIDGGVANVLSMPLIINKSTGKKFGKSEDGAVWLDEAKTSVYKFYQFWLNVDDAGVIDYIKIYTMLTKTEIEELVANQKVDPGSRVAQKTLAREVTTMVHGLERAESVIRVSEVLFSNADFKSLTKADLKELACEIPTVSTGQSVVEILVGTELATGNNDARRLIDGGAVSVNGLKITADQPIEAISLLKKGKNNFILVR